MKRRLLSPRWLLVAAAVMAVLLASESVVLATRTNRSAGQIKSVKVAVSDSHDSAPNLAWGDVPEVTTTISVPSGEYGLFLITFTANYWCYSSHAYEIGNYSCYIRATVDGTAAAPSEYRMTALDDLYPDARTFQWVAGPLKEGTHTVRVQFQGDHSSVEYRLGSRVLTIERAKV